MAALRLDKISRNYKIRISDLFSYHEAIQNRVIKNVLLSFSSEPKGIAYTHVRAFMDLVYGSNLQGVLNLPFGIEVKRFGDNVFVHYNPRKIPGENQNEIEDPISHFLYGNIAIPGIINIIECGLNIKFSIMDVILLERYNFNEKKTAYLDFHKTNLPLTLRSMNPGDRIDPLGMKGTQKLKSLFINEKVPVSMRHKIPILTDAQSIIWVTGMRLSERVKITDETRKIIKVEII
jgi:tRNA(Ile)-lysidine synthase